MKTNHCPLATDYWVFALGVLLLGLLGVAAEALGNPAVCRVTVVESGRVRCHGTGTLVAVDGDTGVVLTCAHLFRDAGPEPPVGLCFLNGESGCRQGKLIAVDNAWDLAAVEVKAPPVEPVTIAAEHAGQGDAVQACGFGPDARYQCMRGQARGYVRVKSSSTYETLQWSGRARDGDSGGPVFNQRGELVAVIWGTDGRVAAGTYSGRVRMFLKRCCPGLFGNRRQPQRPATMGPRPPAATPPMVPIKPTPPEPEAPKPVKPADKPPVEHGPELRIDYAKLARELIKQGVASHIGDPIDYKRLAGELIAQRDKWAPAPTPDNRPAIPGTEPIYWEIVPRQRRNR